MPDWLALAPLVIWPSLLLTALLLLLRAFWEPTRLDCSTVRVQQDESESPPANLRVLLFSDLHAEYFRLPPEHLLRACAEARPDVVVFAGDLTGSPAHLGQALDLMRRIRQLRDLAACPFLAVRGNHDTDRTVEGLRRIGITVLENTGCVVPVRGVDWLVIGLEDLRTGRPDAVPGLALAEAAAVPPGRRLVAAHNPDTLLGLPAGSAAYFLAGHFHGGQVWLPFHLEFLLLRSEKLPRIGHFKGLFAWQGTQAYISRGLGCVSLPLRLFSRPELTLLDISLNGGR